MSLLLHDGHVVTVDGAGRELPGGWVLVSHGLVEAVGDRAPPAPHRVDRLYVGGEEVVRDGHLVRADEGEIARHHRVQARRFGGP